MNEKTSRTKIIIITTASARKHNNLLHFPAQSPYLFQVQGRRSISSSFFRRIHGLLAAQLTAGSNTCQFSHDLLANYSSIPLPAAIELL